MSVIPWYIGNKAGTSIRRTKGDDVRSGIEYLIPLISAMPNLRCVILVGGAARRAHMFLSHSTTARIVSCHHPSAKVVNVNPKAVEENIEIFRFIKATI
jgi:uracil-DNA glycosylase